MHMSTSATINGTRRSSSGAGIVETYEGHADVRSVIVVVMNAVSVIVPPLWSTADPKHMPPSSVGRWPETLVGSVVTLTAPLASNATRVEVLKRPRLSIEMTQVPETLSIVGAVLTTGHVVDALSPIVRKRLPWSAFS